MQHAVSCHTLCADETFSKSHQALMLVDAVFDLEMADRAGIKKVAVMYGAYEEAVLCASRPDLLVDDFSTILDWVGGRS